MDDGDRFESSLRKASMREVADLARVAISSVSRVLSEHPDVSPEMRARVLAAVRRLNYEPDFLAQSLRRGATLSVGYLVSDISNPLHATIACGAESVFRAAGYSMTLMNSEDDPSLDVKHIRFFVRRRVDGLLLSLASDTSLETVDALSRISVPIVLVDRAVPTLDSRVSHVNSDHRTGVRAAVEHLLALGHRRIALISGDPDVLPVRERIAALKEAVVAAGLQDETLVLRGPLTTQHGESATETVLNLQPRPTAIIAGGNQLLAGCLRSLQRHRIRIPEDLSLVTCDEIPLSELYSPPIASVTRDTVELGRVSAELLLRRINDEGPPESRILPTVFLPRPSCGSPPLG
jgi:LacI family transcriptional regulator